MNNDRYQLILSNVTAAGDLLLKERESKFSVSIKEGDYRNIVTSVDIEVDSFIKKSIQSAFPNDKIYSEESADKDSSQGDSFWSIDPIDGTSNFARGIPHFAVCLGYVENGSCVVGAVYNPVTKDLFSFQKGGGAFLNGSPIKVSGIDNLKEAYVLLHIGRPQELRQWGLDLQKKLLDSAKKTINLGSSALDLCFVACGRVDATVYGTLTTLDCAPAIGILHEALGEIYDSSGKPIELTKGPQKIFATSSKALFDQIVG